MRFRIIDIEEKHADGFHACIDIVAKEHKYLALLEAPAIESTRNFVKENIETNQVQLVVLDNEKVVGWCDILKPKLATFSHVGTVGMGLLPEYRGKGIGKEVLKEAIEKAFSSGIERIELMVYVSNQNAVRLYQSLGFVEEGRMGNKAKIEGQYLDMILMVLFKR